MKKLLATVVAATFAAPVMAAELTASATAKVEYNTKSKEAGTDDDMNLTLTAKGEGWSAVAATDDSSVNMLDKATATVATTAGDMTFGKGAGTAADDYWQNVGITDEDYAKQDNIGEVATVKLAMPMGLTVSMDVANDATGKDEDADGTPDAEFGAGVSYALNAGPAKVTVSGGKRGDNTTAGVGAKIAATEQVNAYVAYGIADSDVAGAKQASGFMVGADFAEGPFKAGFEYGQTTDGAEDDGSYAVAVNYKPGVITFYAENKAKNDEDQGTTIGMKVGF